MGVGKFGPDKQTVLKRRATYRLLSVLVAMALGIGLVMIFTLVGDRSQGPIQELLNRTGEAVVSIEDHYIEQKRQDRRSAKMDWFSSYHTDAAKCRNPDRLLLGAYDNGVASSFECIVALEDTLQTQFPLVHLYAAWGSKPEHQFPETKAAYKWTSGNCV